MKTAKHYAMMMVAFLMASISLTSCLDNNDNQLPTLDADVQRTYQTLMSGTHGSIARFYYAKVENYTVTTQKYDSLEAATWRVKNDSTVTFNNFPVNKLDSALQVPATDASSQAETIKAIREAISNVKTPVNLRSASFIPYNTSDYITNEKILTAVYPNVIKQDVTYNGESHTLYFVFTGGTIGTWTRTSMAFEYKMVLAGIAVDQFSPTTGQGNYISSQYFHEVLIACDNK